MSPRQMPSPFGSRTRTRVLLAILRHQPTHARELARLTGCALSVIQNALRTLERDRLIAASTHGRMRKLELNHEYVAFLELVAYLRRLAEAEAAEGRMPDTADRPGPPQLASSSVRPALPGA